MKHILIINQSSELYGSDKALLELLKRFPPGYVPIVVLEEEGPFKEILEKMGIKVIKAPVLKVKRSLLKPLFLLLFPFLIIRALIKIRKTLKGTHIDLVQSNSISVFAGAFYALYFRVKHIWHVHEIVVHPPVMAKWYARAVNALSDKIVFNSKATMEKFLEAARSSKRKSALIYNGMGRETALSSDLETARFRLKNFGVADESIVVIGLIGRISRLKGQQLLLRAFDLLRQKYPNVHLVFSGSAPNGQEHFLSDLLAGIDALDLAEKVTVMDFQKNIWPIYDALDVCVVPSTEPESFGLVAAEAMLSGKPVVASNLGGLCEVVADCETGFLFESGNEESLIEKLSQLLENKQKAAEMGHLGRIRAEKLFSSERYISAFVKLYDEFY